MLPSATAAPVEEAAFVLADHGITDIDAADVEDPHAVTDYVAQIYAHFKNNEVRTALLAV